MLCKLCGQRLTRLEKDRSAPSSPFKQKSGSTTWAFPVSPAKDHLCYTCHRAEFRRAGLTRGGQEIEQDKRKEAKSSERRELIALGGRSDTAETEVIFRGNLPYF